MANSIQQAVIAKQLREKIKTWMLFRLGHPVVKLEIASSWLDIAIDIAVSNFAQWVPNGEKVCVFQATASVNEYNLLDILPEYISIKEVIYSPSMTDALITNFLGGSMATDFQYGGGQASFFQGIYTSMADFAIWNMYQEQYRRTIGREGQARIVGNQLFLSPVPSQNVHVGILYYSMLLDEDVRRDEWIREWALTELKLALGSVRRKYGTLPGPTGDVTLDGADLVSEAREDQKDLRERLKEYMEPGAMITG
jgi:hypothetical protein